ncbi:hypothetical protein DRJ25_04315 [Candidatus Woesearchaeota archaeon]|nr:MAG: hypothetical protein DRJ25_04315 [Candidatus Woesearchaeota archaeon]
MSKKLSLQKLAYLAGFIDGDGSIYVRLKPNNTYKYNYQIAPFVILFQSKKSEKDFKQICSLIKYGYLRERKDGILEYTINRQDDIVEFLRLIQPYLILKKKQAELMIKIIQKKKQVKNKSDFIKLVNLIDKYRELNYSKNRKRHNLTP